MHFSTVGKSSWIILANQYADSTRRNHRDALAAMGLYCSDLMVHLAEYDAIGW